MKNAAVLHNPFTDAPDSLDTKVQIEAVSRSLKKLGYSPKKIEFSLNIQKTTEGLKKINPSFVFNLVEDINDKSRLIHIVPEILNGLKLKYTGSGPHALFTTTDKILAKKILSLHKIKTPPWFLENETVNFKKTFIVKPVSEDASIGIKGDLLFNPLTKQKLFRIVKRKSAALKTPCFAEEYIDGREFNVSLIQIKNKWNVLPPAEIIFNNYPAGKPKVVHYAAKWDEKSFEYNNTPRTFDFTKKDGALLKKIKEICLKCADIFELKGYARVDLRISAKNEIFVIEINANPCIAPDSGFAAAALKAKMSYECFIKEIIENAGAVVKSQAAGASRQAALFSRAEAKNKGKK